MAFANFPFVRFHFRRFIIVGFLTILFSFAAALMGRYLDDQFASEPLFLIIFLIITFFVLQVVLLRIMKGMTATYNNKHFKK